MVERTDSIHAADRKYPSSDTSFEQKSVSSNINDKKLIDEMNNHQDIYALVLAFLNDWNTINLTLMSRNMNAIDEKKKKATEASEYSAIVDGSLAAASKKEGADNQKASIEENKVFTFFTENNIQINGKSIGAYLGEQDQTKLTRMNLNLIQLQAIKTALSNYSNKYSGDSSSDSVTLQKFMANINAINTTMTQMVTTLKNILERIGSHM